MLHVCLLVHLTCDARMPLLLVAGGTRRGAGVVQEQLRQQYAQGVLCQVGGQQAGARRADHLRVLPGCLVIRSSRCGSGAALTSALSRGWGRLTVGSLLTGRHLAKAVCKNAHN